MFYHEFVRSLLLGRQETYVWVRNIQYRWHNGRTKRELPAGRGLTTVSFSSGTRHSAHFYLRRRPLMAADLNIQRLAPASERVSHRTCKKGHVSQLAKKREAVTSSHIRNQGPQLAQLKRRPQSQSQSFQVETGERIAGDHGE
jgi:hypothetical protein